MRWKAYPEYKLSGVDWLESVPSRWIVKRLRFYIQTNPSKGELGNLSSDTLVSFIPMEAVGEWGGLQLDSVKLLEDVNGGYTYFRDGDVLVAKITPCFENGKGTIATGLLNGVGFGTTELHVLRPKSDIDKRHLFYITISQAFRNIGASYMYGASGQKRVPEDFIRNLMHPIPPLEEQHAIAAFLDRETGRIDKLIALKERQIELLQEKRTALISHVVTKGLNPDVRMKDSGVEWLGEIPEGWEIKAVWMLFKLGRGRVISHEEISNHLGEYPVYSSQTESDGVLGFVDNYDFVGNYLTWTTDGANAGTVFERHGKFSCTNVCGTLLAKDQQSNIGYFRHTINLATQWFVRHDINPKLMNNVMASIRVPVPSMEDQKAIMGLLETEIKHHYQLVEQIENSIAMLHEYRTVLISAAVTGKIDVRQEVS